MKKRERIWVLMSIALIGIAIGIEKYFDRTTVYKCTNTVTDLPVFIKIRTFGAIDLLTEGDSWVEANYHHPDGEIYVYAGKDLDYFDDDVFTQWQHPWFDETTKKSVTVHSTIMLDLLTGGYTIGDEISGKNRVMASGFCVKK